MNHANRVHDRVRASRPSRLLPARPPVRRRGGGSWAWEQVNVDRTRTVVLERRQSDSEIILNIIKGSSPALPHAPHRRRFSSYKPLRLSRQRLGLGLNVGLETGRTLL